MTHYTLSVGSELISKLNLKLKRKERRDIEQMFGDISKLAKIYDVELQSKIKDFNLTIEYINIERDVITQLPNPQRVEKEASTIEENCIF